MVAGPEVRVDTEGDGRRGVPEDHLDLVRLEKRARGTTERLSWLDIAAGCWGLAGMRSARFCARATSRCSPPPSVAVVVTADLAFGAVVLIGLANVFTLLVSAAS